MSKSPFCNKCSCFFPFSDSKTYPNSLSQYVISFVAFLVLMFTVTFFPIIFLLYYQTGMLLDVSPAWNPVLGTMYCYTDVGLCVLSYKLCKLMQQLPIICFLTVFSPHPPTLSLFFPVFTRTRQSC